MEKTYGLTVIESVSCESSITYAIKFYLASSSNMIGVHQSHGLTYLETRKALERLGEPMGLEKLTK